MISIINVNICFLGRDHKTAFVQLSNQLPAPIYHNAFNDIGMTISTPVSSTYLQLFDETLDSLPGELLGLSSLAVAHQTVHDTQTRVRRRRRRAGQRRVHHGCIWLGGLCYSGVSGVSLWTIVSVCFGQS